MKQKPVKPPTILLVEPDDEVRPILKENLQNWGYITIVAIDGADALERTQLGNQPFDLILLNQFEQSIDQCMAIGRSLRQQTEFSNQAPIVILAENYGEESEGKDLQVGEREYVTYLEDGQQLKNLLYQLCPIYKN